MGIDFFYPVALPSLIRGIQGHWTSVHEPAEGGRTWKIMHERFLGASLGSGAHLFHLSLDSSWPHSNSSDCKGGWEKQFSYVL